jgi:FMN phosphatase YigB (HAD superfamily)
VIQAVIFDLGNVVIPFDFRRGYAAMEPHCDYPATEIPRRIRSTGLVHRYETGQIESRAFVDELCQALNLSVTFEQFCELWSAIFLPGSLIPQSLFDKLRDRYRLIALSNTNELHFRQVRANYPVIGNFHHLVLSYQVGRAKPDRRIYDEAVTKAGCRPEECFFIDDVPAYVEGALSAGLQAVRFESYSQLEIELRKHGVL